MKSARHERENTASLHLYEVLRLVKIIEAEGRTVPWDEGRRCGELMFNADRVSVWEDARSSVGGYGDGCTAVTVLNATELYP